MTASITLPRGDAGIVYRLRIADTALIQAQRLSAWCGHAPVLEEDIALANMALDLLGQARALLSHVGSLTGHSEDELAFLREERDYFNATLAELPGGPNDGADFAVTTLRNLMLSVWFELLWQALAESSSDAELAAIAAKAVKEARYHHRHAADWWQRLGDGTAESARRAQAAAQRLWPYAAELLHSDTVGDAAFNSQLGPAWSALAEPWRAAMQSHFEAAQVPLPAETAFLSTGTQGRHSEHLGPLLATMQHLQRSFPGGRW
jgi:ring-1,2-phenylacetyl-CoA epoxidase subunit PaaC